MTSRARWICCQIGAREHYSVACALHQQNVLDQLITDVWATRGTWASLAGGSIGNRFHPTLTGATVHSANSASLIFEFKCRVRGRSGWQRMMERNDRFQRFAVRELRRIKHQGKAVTVFAYSYAARLIFEYAQQRGWKTVLGQIDPGPEEERLVRQITPASLQSQLPPSPPDHYWQQWRYETQLADDVVVNSDWSQEALVKEGISPDKIRVIPLAYERPEESRGFTRLYPDKFTSARPLRVLFLGQVSLRKGIAAVFDAVRLTKLQPIEFWFVGPVQVTIPEDIQRHNRIIWTDVVQRDRVSLYYQLADVFIFPSLSDGFGLTQLEAQSWKLPVIASRYCGSVVKHESNGLILDEVSGLEISDALMMFVKHPERLQQMSSRCKVADEFSLSALGSSLINV